jgi:hyperosmotically inducible protein
MKTHDLKRPLLKRPLERCLVKTRSLAWLGLAILTVASLAACATTQPASTQLEDTAIASKVEAKLTSDPQINPFKIDVDVNEGVVRLSGSVEKPEVRAEAEKLAWDTEGVRDVVNEIKLGERTLGERISDGTITAKIKAKLAADPQINPFNINVDTQDQVVTLTGRVKTETARSEAAKLALDTQGVLEVRNHIEVGTLEKNAGR